MIFRPLTIAGAFEITPKIFRDSRGTFATIYEESLFAAEGLVTRWTGDNLSSNIEAGTLRGLHFQKQPSSQTKLVRAVKGRAFDVLVDLRPNSPTFLKWDAVTLDSELANSVYIPKDFAHGYLTLTPGCIISYKVDSTYAPEHEGGLRWDDPVLNIAWPNVGQPIVSPKDLAWPLCEQTSLLLPSTPCG